MSDELFVVYADEDADWARGEFLPALRMAGVHVGDSLDFEPGSNRIEALERAVQTARAVVLVVSAAFLRDTDAAFVDVLARSRVAESGRWNVIPLLLEDVQLPVGLRLAVALDGTSEMARRDAIARLAQEFGRWTPSMTLQSSSGSSGNGERAIYDRIYKYGDELAALNVRMASIEGQMKQLLEIQRAPAPVPVFTEAQLTQLLAAASARNAPNVNVTPGQFLMSLMIGLVIVVLVFGAAYVNGQ